MSSRLTASRNTAYLTAGIALAITLSIVLYPEPAFEASLYGLRLWFDIVLPALLPFFIMSDLLMGLGVVHFTGVLLEPFMRPFFRIPGVGAFAVAIGLASGYPIGAKITGRLRRENLCTRIEAERLVSFANTADPVFMVGAVAVGMFGQPRLGAVIAISHYISVVLVGFIMRFYGGPDESNPRQKRNGSNIFSRALRELYRARIADGRPFGSLFGDAVRESVSSLLFIGGCIVLFSVVIRVLTVAGVTDLLSSLLAMTLVPLGFDAGVLQSIVSGVFEITIGTEIASNAPATLAQRVVAASAIIAWSGLSVHAQVASLLHGTDIRLTPYIMARFCHAVFAAVTAFIIIKLYPAVLTTTSPLPGAQPEYSLFQNVFLLANNGIPRTLFAIILGTLTIAILCASAIILWGVRRPGLAGFVVKQQKKH